MVTVPGGYTVSLFPFKVKSTERAIGFKPLDFLGEGTINKFFLLLTSSSVDPGQLCPRSGSTFLVLGSTTSFQYPTKTWFFFSASAGPVPELTTPWGLKCLPLKLKESLPSFKGSNSAFLPSGRCTTVSSSLSGREMEQASFLKKDFSFFISSSSTYSSTQTPGFKESTSSKARFFFSTTSTDFPFLGCTSISSPSLLTR